MGYDLSDAAEVDLDDVWHGSVIQSGSFEVADRLIRRIATHLAFLGDFPRAGHFRQDLTDRSLRFSSAYNYQIIYEEREEGIFILRILHSARDVSALLGSD